MAKVLGVSLDWLAGNTDEELDAATLQRIQDINKLSQKDKELVFEFLDSFISNRKIKKALEYRLILCTICQKPIKLSQTKLSDRPHKIPLPRSGTAPVKIAPP